MLTYQQGETVFHRLDPRSKLIGQFAVAVAVFARPDPLWILGVTSLTILGLVSARVRLRDVWSTYWFVLVVLALGPVLAGVRVRPPGYSIESAVQSAHSVARIVPILLVSAIYIETTPVRDTQAAIHRLIPGRVGRLLAVAVGLTFRLLPAVRSELETVRAAIVSRGGDHRSRRDQAGRIAIGVVLGSLRRAETQSDALRSRCLAWNPTTPRLVFSAADGVLVCVSIALVLGAFWL